LHIAFAIKTLNITYMSQTGNRNKLLWTVYAPTVFVIVTDEFHTVFASTYLPSVVSVLEAPETLGGKGSNWIICNFVTHWAKVNK